MHSLVFVSVPRLALLACTLVALGGCGGGDGDGGDPDGGADSGHHHHEDAGGDVDVDSANDIINYLEGKTLTMASDDVPSHPHGYNAGTNLGGNTQCYQRVTMQMSGGNLNALYVSGTLVDAPIAGSTGTCDQTVSSGQFNLTTTQILLENVTEGCFDIDMVFNGFTLEGRGAFSDDAQTLELELFFAGQASGHRCESGAVGSETVQMNGAAFTGDAVQVYAIE